MGRYYDPATGQFVSVDPAVNMTEAPYSYAGDDPVTETDPTGLWTEGLCFEVTGSFVAGAASGGVCIVESNGNQEVGIIGTGGYGFAIPLNASAWKRVLKSPTFANVEDLFGPAASVTVGYEISTADNVTDLGGKFKSTTLSLGAGLGGQASYFTGCSPDGPVSGIYLGGGRGIDAEFGSTNTWSGVTLLHGNAENIAIGVINTYTEDPSNFLLRSGLRGLLSAVT